jgi:ASC-1-like (ASCH) protein
MISIGVQEPYKSYILNGQKTVEGRLNKGKFANFSKGDIFAIEGSLSKFEVVGISIYKTFEEMIVSEGLKNVIPDAKDIKEAVQVYYKFYTKEQEKEFGVLAIRVKKL